MKEALRARIDAQPDGLREAIWNLWHEIRTARIARASVRSFAALKGRKDLKVHIGAGDEIKPGWVNIDLMLRVPPGLRLSTGTVLINYDLRRGLPLEDESCELIYSSHFFEHLEYRQGLRLMRDCFRALRPGGTLRLAMPNFRGLFAAYLRGDEQYVDGINIREALPEVEAGTEAFVDHINYGVYQYGEHKYIYDEDKLILVLRRVGFRRAAPSDYREGIDPSSSVRRRYSFYVEAVK